MSACFHHYVDAGCELVYATTVSCPSGKKAYFSSSTEIDGCDNTLIYKSIICCTLPPVSKEMDFPKVSYQVCGEDA
ncbi:MAG: hypothetical protein E7013_02370 [Alphaproteobacteria bacterium]|nr:hypothetical protein [Alphaproteobacteria bacterium]